MRSKTPVRMKRNRHLYGAVLFTLFVFVCFLSALRVRVYGAADRTLTLETARSLALSRSDDYKSAQKEVEEKSAQRESALKAIRLTKADLTTWRWSALLDIKLPEGAKFSEEAELYFKPIKLASEVETARRKLQDTVYENALTVNELYLEIVTTKEEISSKEGRLAALAGEIDRGRVSGKLSGADSKDLKELQKKEDQLTQDITEARRILEADLKELSELTGLDVTTGYEFEDPEPETVLDRSYLELLTEWTEDRDESFYETCAAATTARKQLSVNYELYKKKYGNDTIMLAAYVGQALNGMEINESAFQKDYDAFLTKIDSYYAGDSSILFLKLDNNWTKGELDGTNYIEDDPYTLLHNAQDYLKARGDEEKAKKDLDRKVEDAFNDYIKARSAYVSSKEEVSDSAEEVKRAEVRRKLGKETAEEVGALKDAYFDAQDRMRSDMADYMKAFYELDRLCCGGVSALISGEDPDMMRLLMEESYIEKETGKAMYYIRPIVQREMFELSVSIPLDFPVDITDFELWCDGVLIGEKTNVRKTLRELTIKKEGIGRAVLRFYTGADFVDDCVIDPSLEKGTLDITLDVKPKGGEGELCGYSLTESSISGLVTLRLLVDEAGDLGYFRLLTKEGTVLGGGSYTPVNGSFSYLKVLSSDLSDLTIDLYDTNKEFLYGAHFNTGSHTIEKNE
ncbi:MAG: hypothetical protein IJT16_09460 [Lachnospiraceae bacterium]|nr:hypothetical protein [Lachnospiraceae bacterium]